MRERELKRALPAEAELPDLGDAIPGAVLGPAEVRQVDDRYHDTADLRLARWGVTLRWRQGTGWTLKLPRLDQKPGRKGTGALDRDELVLTGRAAAPPPRAVAAVSSLIRSEPLVPVVQLVNERSGRIWHGADGAAMAEQVDDRVIATVLLDAPPAAPAREVRFREVEVELAADADPAVLDRVAERLPSTRRSRPLPS